MLSVNTRTLGFSICSPFECQDPVGSKTKPYCPYAKFDKCPFRVIRVDSTDVRSRSGIPLLTAVGAVISDQRLRALSGQVRLLQLVERFNEPPENDQRSSLSVVTKFKAARVACQALKAVGRIQYRRQAGHPETVLRPSASPAGQAPARQSD